ncbi:DUF58 domain-containing protein [cf. Phormidesmis sp. LEGE 11477]|uniref:DUF58 domain-containing protein n=1 Tax=cf. Phormidesmis sp. LEGE 11477 TaxID=1828680 RepID=UPI00187F2A72|nr:DUF58 domain-containing protein [cf. Phormidesmis sp. LEGE 11477]MBE9059609.1 DUF58 domain-containing protein [cf. Phormidesmis sp. LEGE 11477]
MVPTRRTYGLLIAGGAAATVLATFTGGGGSGGGGRVALALLAVLCFDGAVLLAMLWDGIMVKQRRVQIVRDPLQRLSIGRDNHIELQITSKTAADILIYDRYPVAFDGPDMPLRAMIAALNTASSGSLDQTVQTLDYTVNPKRRGDYTWGDIDVRQRGPLKLAWSGWRIPATESAAVYPDLIGLRQLTIRLALQSTGTLKQKRKLGVGTEFAELREYDVGDDPRFIDWKATARRSQPLVRALEPEREQTLIILLDRGRLMTAQVQGLSRFDWGLNATLALALAGIRRGDRVGIGIFDRTMHTWMPPKRGQPYLRQMIEQLTPIQPTLVESDYFGAVTQVVRAQNRRALVVAITDVIDQTASAELLSALVRLRPRYLPFCVTLRDPHVDQQAAATQPDISGAYEKAVAIDLIAQRRAALSRLKKSGVMVLDAPANAITEALVDNYLRIKARALL